MDVSTFTKKKEFHQAVLFTVRTISSGYETRVWLAIVDKQFE